MKEAKTLENLKTKDIEPSHEYEQIGARHTESIGTLNDAIAIAANVHKGQTDKAGDPYILHPLRIMMKMASYEARIAAVLHDVVEDSPPEDRWTLERLRDVGFSDEVVEAVDGVTDRKGQGESYEEFVDRACVNPISRAVKIADLEDNMNMLRLDVVSDKSLERLAKYHRSWKRLKAYSDKV